MKILEKKLNGTFSSHSMFVMIADVSISLTLEKQIVKNIPKSEHDVIIDWIVTEDRVLKTQR